MSPLIMSIVLPKLLFPIVELEMPSTESIISILALFSSHEHFFSTAGVAPDEGTEGTVGTGHT